jgi:hypothetical protein
MGYFSFNSEKNRVTIHVSSIGKLQKLAENL